MFFLINFPQITSSQFFLVLLVPVTYKQNLNFKQTKSFYLSCFQQKKFDLEKLNCKKTNKKEKQKNMKTCKAGKIFWMKMKMPIVHPRKFTSTETRKSFKIITSILRIILTSVKCFTIDKLEFSFRSSLPPSSLCITYIPKNVIHTIMQDTEHSHKHFQFLNFYIKHTYQMYFTQFMQHDIHMK